MSFDFSNAFYIKLGLAGRWEEDSIKNGVMRLGWKNQSIDDINAHRWDVIETQLRSGNRANGTATADLNRLRDITTSNEHDVWITFNKAKLWWARLSPGPIASDTTSKYRTTVDGWHDTSLTGRLLITNELPGKIAALQGFRGTVCRVRERELLQRVIAGGRSELAIGISNSRQSLAALIEKAIRELHWKDFETLTDLVFRHTGWERVSVLGQHAKAYDLELRESITGDRYVVQIKSQTCLSDVLSAASEFSENDYRRLFFVVHSPSRDLAGACELPGHVELIDPAHLAVLTLDAGLSKWLEDKVA